MDVFRAVNVFRSRKHAGVTSSVPNQRSGCGVRRMVRGCQLREELRTSAAAYLLVVARILTSAWFQQREAGHARTGRVLEGQQ